MEPADIDWKTVDSRYVRDDAFENINAPKWVDLAAANATTVDDEAWFCRPDCKHPKTFEDFQRWVPAAKAKGKLVRSNTEVLHLGERNRRDAALKRRGGIGGGTGIFSSSSSSSSSIKPKKFRDDAENLDPNVCTPPPPPRTRPLAAVAGGKTVKDAIKSSAEKSVVGGGGEEECQNNKTQRKLRSTLSARNLFSGKDILSQISEFCNELKKLATRKERSAAGAEEAEKKQEEKGLLQEVVEQQQQQQLGQKAALNQNTKRINGSAKKSSRMALRVETEKDISDSSSALKEVRAHPPTPQRFPSPLNRQPRKAKAPATTINSSPLSKPPKSSALERGVLQEMNQCREEKKALVSKDEECNKVSDVADAENRPVDVLWFLKPCTYLV